MIIFTLSYSYNRLFEGNQDIDVFMLRWETMMVERYARNPIVAGEMSFRILKKCSNLIHDVKTALIETKTKTGFIQVQTRPKPKRVLQ